MRRSSPILIAVALIALSVVSASKYESATAQLAPTAHVPTWSHSVEVINDEAAVYKGPNPKAGRRGTIAAGTRLKVKGMVAGEVCPRWYSLDGGLYMCQRHAKFSTEIPFGLRQPVMKPNELLPLAYAFVAYDGARTYVHPQDYFADQFYEALGVGFGVVVGRRQVYEGVAFNRTRKATWIEAAALRRARGSSFEGVEISGPLDIAWTRKPNVPIYRRRGKSQVRRAGRREVVHVIRRDKKWATLSDGTFVRLRDLHLSELQTDLPSNLPKSGRWMDISVAQQVLVLYEGAEPKFATLVSTGKDRKRQATPLGDHQIWVKLAYSDMSDLARTDLERNYAIEQVPWVQYFNKGNGLHTAFWHNDFGRRRSHGCVNLSPKDARRVFDFTEPRLPDGWKAIFPDTAHQESSVVRVRP